MDVVWILIAVGALLVGIGIGYWLHSCSPEVCKAKEDLENLQQEYSNYRGQVDSHFNRSAELFQDMTMSYKAVYDHLAGGVQELCKNPGQQSIGQDDTVVRFPEFGETQASKATTAIRDEVVTPKVDEDTETEWEANAASVPHTGARDESDRDGPTPAAAVDAPGAETPVPEPGTRKPDPD